MRRRKQPPATPPWLREQPAGYLTAQESAAMHNISLRQLRRYVAAGHLKHTATFSGSETNWREVHLYRQEDVEKLQVRGGWRRYLQPGVQVNGSRIERTARQQQTLRKTRKARAVRSTGKQQPARKARSRKARPRS